MTKASHHECEAAVVQRLPKGCSLADQRLISRLLENPPARTDEGLNDRFGISYNSWRRLMAGQPVRTSLLKRLEQRLGMGGAL